MNSTLACALAAAKLGIPVAHLEAGLRSGDWTMPEEINRVLTDRLSDLLLTHSPEARGEPRRARAIDTTPRALRRQHDDRLAAPLRGARARARRLDARTACDEREYVLVTLHRPSNVDEPARLAAHRRRRSARSPRRRRSSSRCTRARARGSPRAPTLDRLEAAGVRCTEPVGYLDFLSLQAGAGAIVTDSGGVQEEASALGVPCYTLRANTERPGDDQPRHERAARRRPRAPARRSG